MGQVTVGRWLVVPGAVVLAAWAARKSARHRQVCAISREHRALVQAADWTLRRARLRAIRGGQMVLVTVDEVLARTTEDSGPTPAVREHAAAVLRERLHLLGGCADIVTDSDLHQLPALRADCAGHRPLWGDPRPAW